MIESDFAVSPTFRGAAHGAHKADQQISQNMSYIT